tara:strand:- start:118 stop:900 length:783 start_codon:yes stop_codon:yes gene_type:complete
MKVDRRAFIASVGGASAVAAMSHEGRAEALEHYMTHQLDHPPKFGQPGQPVADTLVTPLGTGNLFRPTDKTFDAMPENATLRDFFLQRFAPARHVLQSANYALKTGQPERTVFACLLHDVTQNLMKADHGYWGAQLFEPYVDERVSWGIRYHQALRFFPDLEAGYEYPEMYNRIFGVDYEPDAYIKAAHDFARKHRYYMEARLITINDQYAFDPDAEEVTIDKFEDIIRRQFKQPKEGLGYDGSPVAHMWRSIMNPNRPL